MAGAPRTGTCSSRNEQPLQSSMGPARRGGNPGVWLLRGRMAQPQSNAFGLWTLRCMRQPRLRLRPLVALRYRNHWACMAAFALLASLAQCTEGGSGNGIGGVRHRSTGHKSMTEKKTAKETKSSTIVANDPADLQGRLKNIGGSRSDHWNNILANQTIQTLWVKHSDAETR